MVRPGGYAHRIKNTTATPIRFIDAEVLAPAGAGAGARVPEALPRHKLEVENAKVRIYRVTLEPGETTGPHAHGLPLLRVEVTGGQVAVSGRDRPARGVLAFAPGQYQWIEGESRTLTNSGNSRYELIEIEWR